MFAAAMPQTPLGELTAHPRPTSKGGEGLAEGTGRGGKGMRGDERGGDPPRVGSHPMSKILKNTVIAEVV